MAAIDFSAGLFGSNDYEATRQTIDISGDGSESNACVFSTFSCASLQNARDAFATAGPLGAERTINAIGIYDRHFFGDDAADSIQSVPSGLQNLVTANHSFNGRPSWSRKSRRFPSPVRWSWSRGRCWDWELRRVDGRAESALHRADTARV